MSNRPFTVYSGKFICKECHQEVLSMRLWRDTGMVSWMCKDKHLSEVQLLPIKKKKRDYEREERE